MDSLISLASLSDVVLFLNLFLCLVLISHLLRKFSLTSNKWFRNIWVSFWIAIAAQYLYHFLRLRDNSYVNILLTVAISNIATTLLGLSSEYIYAEHPGSRSIWIKWSLVFICVQIACVSINKSLSYDTEINVSNYYSYFGLLIFTGRIYRTVKKMEFISLLLYFYASVFIVSPLFQFLVEPYEVAFIFSLVLPLKISLYISGFMYLTSLSRAERQETVVADQGQVLVVADQGQVLKETFQNENIEVFNNKAATESHIKKRVQPKHVVQPKPNVEVSLTGIWGFIYIMWHYPSGRFVVFVILITLALSLIYVVTYINVVKNALDFIQR